MCACVLACASRRTQAHRLARHAHIARNRAHRVLRRHARREETLARAAQLAASNEQRWSEGNARVAELHAQQNALEEERRRAAAASRHHDFISGGGGRVPPGQSRSGLGPAAASSGFGSSSQLRSRLSIEALLAEEPSACQRLLEEKQARLLADRARREARRGPAVQARREIEGDRGR